MMQVTLPEPASQNLQWQQWAVSLCAVFRQLGQPVDIKSNSWHAVIGQTGLAGTVGAGVSDKSMQFQSLSSKQ